MIALLQRVLRASVHVDSHCIGAIQQGLLAFIGIEKQDSEQDADRLLQRILGYRVFADNADKMNLSLSESKGGLLLVSQFTLAADTNKGMRPSFTPAATPEEGKRLFEYLVVQAAKLHQLVASGQFGANMQVELVNDGPVTFWLQTKKGG